MGERVVAYYAIRLLGLFMCGVWDGLAKELTPELETWLVSRTQHDQCGE